jgi:UbiD family decarboxylase
LERIQYPDVKRATDITDLRSALGFLASTGQLTCVCEPVDPYLELAGVYRKYAAATPSACRTHTEPAILFEKTVGFDMPVAAGVLASRQRSAALLGSTPERLIFDLLSALDRPVPTIAVPASQAPCQEVVLRPPFDMRRILPATTSTARDAGPFVNMGVLRAQDPDTGVADVTIHRICVHGPDRVSVAFAPGRHIDVFRKKAEARGEALPASVSIGLDPAVYISTTFTSPTTPIGFDELTIAGALRGRPVELVECLTVAAKALARAEIVLEGEFLPGERADEDVLTGEGWAMPEFPGYVGLSSTNQPVLHITAVTHRTNPIYQTLVGPGEEHVTLAGLPTETSIFRQIDTAMPGFLRNVYCHSAGGGKLLAILQVSKRSPSDEGRQRQAAILALACFHELKHVIVVDDDVDLYDSADVMWAMTTRFQGDMDTIVLPGVTCHAADPSETPGYNPLLRAVGTTCKTIFDCTVPYDLRERFERSRFMDVDLMRFPSLPQDRMRRVPVRC